MRSDKETVIVDTTSGLVAKDELYRRAEQWSIEVFNNSRKVIKMKDKEAGIIIGKTLFTYSTRIGMAPQDHVVNYQLKIMAKEGKYRFEITNVIDNMYSTVTSENELPAKFNSGVGVKYHQKHWNELQQMCESYFSSLKGEIYTGMNKSASGKLVIPYKSSL